MRITLRHRLFAFGFGIAMLIACGGGITPGASAISPLQNAQPATARRGSLGSEYAFGLPLG